MSWHIIPYVGERRGKNVLLPFQLAVLVGVPITYTVIGGSSLREFVGLVAPSVVLPSQMYYLIFGGLQLCLSMVRWRSGALALWLASWLSAGMESTGQLLSFCTCLHLPSSPVLLCQH